MILRLLFPALLFIISTLASATITLRDGCFYKGDKRVQIVGVNLENCDIHKDSVELIKDMGFNAVRVKFSKIEELQRLLKLMRRHQLLLWAVLDKEFPIEQLKELKKHKNLISWEVENQASAIKLKSCVPNQLVCVSCDDSKPISLTPSFEKLARSNAADLLTLQLAPLDYNWVAPTNLFLGLKHAFLKTNLYLNDIRRVAAMNNKPLVVTSCTYPRDKMFRFEGTNTYNRDSYFAAVLSFLSGESPVISACFFSFWSSTTEITDDTPKIRATYSIYANDASTKEIILKSVSQ